MPIGPDGLLSSENNMRLQQSLKYVLLLLAGLAGAAQAADDMSLARDSHDVKVWTYPIPNYPIRGFKAVTVVKSTLAGLVNLIMDTDNAPKWVYRTNQITIVKRDDSQQSFTIHVETDFPWPLKDRDVYVQGKISQDPKTLVVSVVSQSTPAGMFPVDSHFVRMPDMQGLWQFKPLGKGMVEVTMSGRADPSGAIPASVVNLVIQETPYNTMRGLREAVGEDKYQKNLLKQIIEPTE